MPPAPLPKNEQERLAALHRLNILDTAPDVVLDAMTELARSALDMPIAALSLIDADRQWFKSIRGLTATQTPREESFCAHTILDPDQVMVVPDATKDPRFADNPSVTGDPGLRFYAGAPLSDSDGNVLGALCVADHRPRVVGAEQLRTLQQLAGGISAALQLHGCAQELNRLALTDPLTGLANRAAFDQRLRAACEAASGSAPAEAALLMLDLDGFKGINDLFGHPGGDRALCEVARRLQRVARSGDLVARLGGDEFALLCSGPAARTTAMAVAERVHAALADTFHIDGQLVPLRTSVGIAEIGRTGIGLSGFGLSGTDPVAVAAAADAALYVAKRAGRGVTRTAEDRARPAAQAPDPVIGRQTLQALLRDGLLPPGHEPFSLHFQPILNLKERRVCAFEALVRWTLPDGRSVSPAEFVPLAEANGLVAHLDRWVLGRACAIAAGWPEGWAVSVNLSPASVAVLDVVSLVQETLATTGLAPDRLRLELTETMQITEQDRMARAIRQLRSLGVAVAVDDFGSGYASLAHLQRFAFSAVKLDRSLTTTLGEDEQAREVLKAVMRLTKALGLPVIAEGVETREQLQILRKAGVARVQGYLLGRPVPAEQVVPSARSAEGILSQRAPRTSRRADVAPAPYVKPPASLLPDRIITEMAWISGEDLPALTASRVEQAALDPVLG